MYKKISVSLILIYLSASSNLFSQIYTKPNYALKSHETLEMLKVESAPASTILYLSIENRIEGGTFCADKKIYLLDADGTKYDLKKSVGIPTCPVSYKFKNIGEKLAFTLEFPPLKQGTKWIDLIEECSSNCFSLYGITLDGDLNKKLDEGFSLADKGENGKAISVFSEILNSTDSKMNGIDGALYTEIVTMEFKSGNISNAREWYKRMLSSNSPRLNLYIKNLNSRGIKF
jgi:hypothetical protein